MITQVLPLTLIQVCLKGSLLAAACMHALSEQRLRPCPDAAWQGCSMRGACRVMRVVMGPYGPRQETETQRLLMFAMPQGSQADASMASEASVSGLKGGAYIQNERPRPT